MGILSAGRTTSVLLVLALTLLAPAAAAGGPALDATP